MASIVQNFELGLAGAFDAASDAETKLVNRIAGTEFKGTHLAADLFTSQGLQDGSIAPEVADTTRDEAIKAEDSGKVLAPAAQKTYDDVEKTLTFFGLGSLAVGAVAVTLAIIYRKPLIAIASKVI